MTGNGSGPDAVATAFQPPEKAGAEREVYAAAARGDIKTVQLDRLKRVPSAWLKAKLGLDQPTA